MGLFKRGDFIDIPEMQKRGFVKKSKETLPSNIKVNKDGTIEFLADSSANSLSDPFSNNSGSSSANSSSGTLGFLDSFASIGSQNQSNTNDLPNLVNNSSTDLSSLRVKIDDLEYKLERLIERLEKMEGKG